MSEMPDERRSAVVFGARNLGRAIIELLVNGRFGQWRGRRGRRAPWMASARRAHSHCEPTSRTPRACTEYWSRQPPPTVESSSWSTRPPHTVANAPGPSAAVRLPRPTSTALPRGPLLRPARPSRSCPPADDSQSPQGRPATLVQVTGGSARRAMARSRPVGGRIVRRSSDHQRGCSRASAHRASTVTLLIRRRRHSAARRGPHAPVSLRKRWPTHAGSPDAVLFLANQGRPLCDARSFKVTPLAEILDALSASALVTWTGVGALDTAVSSPHEQYSGSGQPVPLLLRR